MLLKKASRYSANHDSVSLRDLAARFRAGCFTFSILGEAETTFRAREDNGRMKDEAAHACVALCRARVLQEIRGRKGTTTAEHLKLVLSIIDRPTNLPLRDH